MGGEEGAASQRVCAAVLHPAHESRRRLAQSIAAGGWVIPCAANALVDEGNAVPFSGQLVAWGATLGFNVVDTSRGGRQIGGTECASSLPSTAWPWPKLVTLGARFLLHRWVLQHPSYSSNMRQIGRRSGQLRASVTTRSSDTLRSRLFV